MCCTPFVSPFVHLTTSTSGFSSDLIACGKTSSSLNGCLLYPQQFCPFDSQILLVRLLHLHYTKWSARNQRGPSSGKKACCRSYMALAIHINMKDIGLQKTDNNLDLTIWPQVNMINQKNYYTFVPCSAPQKDLN